MVRTVPLPNIPKASLVLVTVAFGLYSLGAGFVFLLFGTANDPDVTITFRDVLLGIIAPLSLAVYSGRLLRREGDTLRKAARNPWLVLAAAVWLIDIGVAAFLALYFGDDAAFHRVQYRGLLIGQSVVTLLAALSYGAAFASVWAIARSVRAAAALGLLVLLVAAAFLSEATSVWLGL